MALVAFAAVVVTSVHGAAPVVLRYTPKPVSLFELSVQRTIMLTRVAPLRLGLDGAIGSRPGVVAVAMFDQAELPGEVPLALTL